MVLVGRRRADLLQSAQSCDNVKVLLLLHHEPAGPCMQLAEVLLLRLARGGDQQGRAADRHQVHQGGVAASRNDVLRGQKPLGKFAGMQVGHLGHVAYPLHLMDLGKPPDHQVFTGHALQLLGEQVLQQGALGLRAADDGHDLMALRRDGSAMSHAAEHADVAGVGGHGRAMGKIAGQSRGIRLIHDPAAVEACDMPQVDLAQGVLGDRREGEELVCDDHAGQVDAADAEALIADHRVQAQLLTDAVELCPFPLHALHHRRELAGHAPELAAASAVTDIDAGDPHLFQLREFIAQQGQGASIGTDDGHRTELQQAMDDGDAARAVPQPPIKGRHQDACAMEHLGTKVRCAASSQR